LWPALNKTPGDEEILFKELKDLHSDTNILIVRSQNDCCLESKEIIQILWDP